MGIYGAHAWPFEACSALDVYNSSILLSPPPEMIVHSGERRGHPKLGSCQRCPLRKSFGEVRVSRRERPLPSFNFFRSNGWFGCHVQLKLIPGGKFRGFYGTCFGDCSRYALQIFNDILVELYSFLHWPAARSCFRANQKSGDVYHFNLK